MVFNLLDREQYQEHEINSDEEFAYAVERFEFELFDHFKTNKVAVSTTQCLFKTFKADLLPSFLEILPDSAPLLKVCGRDELRPGWLHREES